MNTDILITEKLNNVCILTLNRPDKMNSLTDELLIKIIQEFESLSNDTSIHVVIIRGAGNKAFCSGYDIGKLQSITNKDVFKKNYVEQAFQTIADYPFPVIAMINGIAFGGGCELAASCDIRISAKSARIAMTPAKIGVVYSAMGLQRFINIIGVSSAKEMFFTANIYSGIKLKEMGLVDYLVDDNELWDFTHDMAKKIAKNAPLSLKGTKKVLNMLTNKVNLNAQEQDIAHELMTQSFFSHDLKEGQKAFAEKRSPIFKGK